MIDIVFLLIIFFMVGTKFTELERNIALQVPQVRDAAALTAAPERRVINVSRDGHITLDQIPVTLDELHARLADARSQYAEMGVLVRGDGEGRYQEVAEVLNACSQAGIRNLGIAVRPLREAR